MQQLAQFWSQLDSRRKVIVLGATAIVFLGLVGLTRLAAQPNYALLYSGLSPKASGQVLAALDAQGVAHDVRNSAIYVDAMQRDTLRLTLAAEGLPAGDVNGYELLDSLSGFGTTSQMFDAAYMRAKEGELARTIMANPQITAARVHIAAAGNSPFKRAETQTASVSLRGAGGGVSDDTAEAIRFLISSAVSGLQPGNVSVIDADRGTVISQNDTASPQQLGLDRADILKRNVERIVEARTGTGNAVVEVNVETLTDDERITERLFDPEGRVVVSTQTNETSRNSQNSEAGDVTVASNLPEGDGAGSGQSNSEDTETQETINYELSETTRELRKMPGSIRRISVAVLVDGIEAPGEDGQPVWQARPETELVMLEDLVKSAVGFDAARGDSVTIRSMELPSLALDALDVAAPGWVASQNLDVMKLVQLAVTGLVVLVLGLFVIRPIVIGALARAETPPILPEAGQIAASEGGISGDVTLPGSGPAALPSPQSAQGSGVTRLPATAEDADPVTRLKQLIDERQDDTVEILRGWIETPEETG